MRKAWFAAALLGAGVIRAAPESRVLFDFESTNTLRAWLFKHQNTYFTDKPAFTPELSERHATAGARSLRVAPTEYLNTGELPRDWSGYDALELDVFVEGEAPVSGYLLIADRAWREKPTYWNRHNGAFSLRPGANTVSVSVTGLYRGEAGSRANDLRTCINPAEIVRVDFGFSVPTGRVAALYLDNLRLTRERRPEGILAVDFGPESQVLFPGFTPVSWNTVYGQAGRTLGLRRPCYHPNRARDDTFPTRLYQDFVWFEEGDNEFLVELPNGRYGVWLVFDDCGYWGGETCRHQRRAVLAEGHEVWVDDRGPEGPADYLFRFERVEPKPGDNVWDLYVRDLFKPVRFEVEVRDGQLSLATRADAPWSTKVAALVVYPETARTAAESWLAEVEQRNRREFEDRAVCLDPPPATLTPPPGAKREGCWIGYPEMEDEVSLFDPPGEGEGHLRRPAARGQHVSFTFAVRPLADCADPVRLVATDLRGPGRSVIPAVRIDLRYVHHALRRGFDSVAYRIRPEGLRRVEGAGLRLAPGLTRQFWVTVAVPDDTAAGVHEGRVTLTAGKLSLTLPVVVDVVDVRLVEPDFSMGFFGTAVPAELPEPRRQTAWKELLTLLRASGMNSLSGGPDVLLSGFDAEGRPMLDFAACDAFFATARACGFNREVFAYGGPGMVRGLHDPYVVGETGRAWERKTGRAFPDLLRVVWTAVSNHAAQAHWLPVAYEFTDEPRVEETIRTQLELMRMYREAVPFVKIGGSYSVRWGDDPVDRGVQEIFRTLAWSALNLHTPTDLDKAREYGKELHIYNQGISRYSFGAYQWAEWRKGICGRIQWHLLALHGYQFFDLDGREPDTAMVNWGRTELIPTVHLHRCREGADDFRFAATLHALASRQAETAAGREALEWLDAVSRPIAVGQRERPPGFMDDETFRATCIAHLRKLASPRSGPVTDQPDEITGQ